VDPSVTATVAQLQKQFGERTVRVILTVKETRHDKISDAQQKVTSVLREAGVILAEPIAGQPFVVVECRPAQLETAARTGLINRIQPDRLDAPQ
jgi:hypothetical protein